MFDEDVSTTHFVWASCGKRGHFEGSGSCDGVEIVYFPSSKTNKQRKRTLWTSGSSNWQKEEIFQFHPILSSHSFLKLRYSLSIVT